MDLGIQGKKALVMGSSTGIGRAIAETLVKEGATVTISSRSADRLEKTKSEIGAHHAITSDLDQAGAGRELVKKASAEMGGLDILVTNTGGPPKGTFEKVTSEQWETGFRGVFMSAVDGIHEALPGMKKNKWGRIVLVTSVSAKEPFAQLMVSNGFRSGLLGLTRSIAREVAGDGITVNGLLPGYTLTDRLTELNIPLESIAETIPAGRIGKPEELGDLAAFLASDRAAYINGQSIVIDGAWVKGI